jgi:hypothetical protein
MIEAQGRPMWLNVAEPEGSGVLSSAGPGLSSVAAQLMLLRHQSVQRHCPLLGLW